MSCCNQKQISDEGLCKDCFIKDVENRVRETIEQFSMLKKTDNVAVAVSGGKDSLTVLSLLKKFGYNVTAITIDEGIAGYRNETIEDSQKFCLQNDITLKIYSFKDAFGFTLDEQYKGGSACLSCGVFRRYVLNKAAKEFDVIATGHNLDDEVQSILMNFLKGNLKLAASQGPVSGTEKGLFTQRIKPLYFIPEKEVKMYSFLKQFSVKYSECPYAKESFRFHVRDAINTSFGKKEKLNIAHNFLGMLPKLKGNLEDIPASSCVECGEVSFA